MRSVLTLSGTSPHSLKQRLSGWKEQLWVVFSGEKKKRPFFVFVAGHLALHGLPYPVGAGALLGRRSGAG